MVRKRKQLIDLIEDEHLKQKLRQPLDAPLELTEEEALAILKAGIGGRPDLASGEEYVEEISKIWRGFVSH